MALSGTKDLTNGKPIKLIIGFALPLMLGIIFQQFYNMVDSAIVGKTLGADKLGAVGSTGSINFLILGFCMGTCSGFAIPIAQRFGARDNVQMRRYVFNSVYLTIGCSLILGIATALLCPTILRLLDTQPALFDYSVSYIRVIFAFIPVTMAYNLAAGILRSLGDSKTPVVFLIISAFLNVALDLTFILLLKMDVAGAAWATVISQTFAGIGCIVVLVKKFTILRPESDEAKPRKRDMLDLLSMGLPMGLQFSITAIGSVVLQTAVNGISTVAVSGLASGVKLQIVFTCIYDALANTMATFAGQNVGAKKLDRVSEGLKSAAIIGTIISVTTTIIIWLFADKLMLIFLNPDETEVIAHAVQFLRVNSSLYFFLLVVNIVRLTIQGMGFTRVAMIAGTLEMFGRAGVALLLVPKFGYDAVCFANPVAWIMADIFLYPCYKHTMQRLRNTL